MRSREGIRAAVLREMESIQGHGTLYQQSVPQGGLQECSLTSEKAQQLQALCSHTHIVLASTRCIPKGCRFVSSSDPLQKGDTSIYSILPTRKLRHRGAWIVQIPTVGTLLPNSQLSVPGGLGSDGVGVQSRADH